MATDPVFAAVEQKAREIVNDPDVTDAQAAQWMAGVRWALAAVRWRQEIRPFTAEIARVIDRLPIAAPDPTPPALDARPDALREALDRIYRESSNYDADNDHGSQVISTIEDVAARAIDADDAALDAGDATAGDPNVCGAIRPGTARYPLTCTLRANHESKRHYCAEVWWPVDDAGDARPAGDLAAARPKHEHPFADCPAGCGHSWWPVGDDSYGCNAALHLAVVAVLADMRRFGRHLDSCATRGGNPLSLDCDCGLALALGGEW